MRVSSEGTSGVSVAVFLAARGVSQLPDNHGLVTRRRQKEVGVLGGSGKGGDPVSVTGKGSAKAQSFTDSRHDSIV